MTGRWRRTAVRKVVGTGLHLLTGLAGGPPPGLRRGVGRAAADVPTTAVVVVRTSTEAVAGLLEAMAGAGSGHLDLTPVFLVDQPVLTPFRQAGYVVELVGPAGLAAAVREMRLSYDCASVVVVDGGGPRSWERLPELLAALAPGCRRGPAEVIRRFLRRLETWADTRSR